MECPICYANYDESNMVRTICNHTFHHTCLKLWLLSDEQGTCPCCRFQFKKRNDNDENEKDDQIKKQLIVKITEFFDILQSIENTKINTTDKHIEKMKLVIYIFNYFCEEKEHLHVLGKQFIYTLYMKLIDIDKDAKSEPSFFKPFQKKLNKYKKKLRKHFEWANETDFQYEMEIS